MKPLFEPTKPDLHRFADLHFDRVCRGICAAIDGEVVRLASVHWHRGKGQALAQQPFLQLQGVFVIGAQAGVVLGRIDDHHAVESKGLLAVDMIM